MNEKWMEEKDRDRKSQKQRLCVIVFLIRSETHTQIHADACLRTIRRNVEQRIEDDAP